MVKTAEMTGHTSRVLHLAQSPDGTTVVSAAADETLRQEAMPQGLSVCHVPPLGSCLQHPPLRHAIMWCLQVLALLWRGRPRCQQGWQADRPLQQLPPAVSQHPLRYQVCLTNGCPPLANAACLGPACPCLPAAACPGAAALPPSSLACNCGLQTRTPVFLNTNPWCFSTPLPGVSQHPPPFRRFSTPPQHGGNILPSRQPQQASGFSTNSSSLLLSE